MYTIRQYDGRGKHKITLESESLALCKLYALQNTTGKGETIVEDDCGLILYHVKGQGNNQFPLVADLTKVLR